MMEIEINNEKHKLLYVDYINGLPDSAVTTRFIETADVPYWRLYSWDFFADGGDPEDIRFYAAGSGGTPDEGIDAPKFIRPVEAWISDELKLNGESQNLTILTEPRGNPFENAEESFSYIYCERCGCHHNDYMDDTCDHMYWDDENGGWRYYDTNAFIQ